MYKTLLFCEFYKGLNRKVIRSGYYFKTISQSNLLTDLRNYDRNLFYYTFEKEVWTENFDSIKPIAVVFQCTC